MKLARFPALMLLLLSVPALACPPPVPGAPEPVPVPISEQASSIAGFSTDIVYGVVLGSTADDMGYRFKVLHVYKGSLHRGQIIKAQASWGFNRPPCWGMTPPPPLSKGDYGVIAYRGEPEMTFLDEPLLKAMFHSGLIRSAQASRRR